MAKRKGAARRADVLPEVLAELNAGTLETATLSEGLVIDFTTLLANVAPEVGPAARSLADVKGYTGKMAAAADLLIAAYGPEVVPRYASHTSDTVRGWAAYAIGRQDGLTLRKRIQLIKPLADDPHFGVREWAWMAVRPAIAQRLPEAIKLLEPWSRSKSESIRRFASEVTRPRGVWCSHIEALKSSPELALPILEPLRADKSRYVQLSVGNWLNDASKTRADWVRNLCEDWLQQDSGPETMHICRRALRTIQGKPDEFSFGG